MNVCGYCGKQSSISLYPTSDIYGNAYEIHQCKECKAFFLAPRPDTDRLSQAYDSSYYGEQEEKFSSSKVEKVLDMFRKRRAKELSRYLDEKELAMLLFVLLVVKNSNKIAQGDVDKLRDLGWTDADILDATYHGTTQVGVDKIFNAFKIEQDM